MRDWTKTLPNASFRGQSFFVDEEELSDAGRKVAEHDYAKSEQFDDEDMGKKRKRFSFEAYIVGDNADSDARAFVDLCSQPGSGQLRLPIFGTYTVRCTDCTGHARKTEMGRVGFKLQFIESGTGGFTTSALGDRIAASLQGGMSTAIVSALSSFAG